MKYNVVKLDVTDRPMVIEFLAKNVSIIFAKMMLTESFYNESMVMFQDINNIIYKDNDLDYFDVNKNGRKIRYAIEIDMFEQIAFSSKYNFEPINQN